MFPFAIKDIWNLNKVCGLHVDAVQILFSLFWGLYWGYVGQCYCFEQIVTKVFRGDGALCLQFTFKWFLKKSEYFLYGEKENKKKSVIRFCEGKES